MKMILKNLNKKIKDSLARRSLIFSANFVPTAPTSSLKTENFSYLFFPTGGASWTNSLPAGRQASFF